MPSRTNAFTTFPLPGFASLKESGSYIPRGDLFRFGINPNTGEVVLSYQKDREAMALIQDVLDHLNETLDEVRAAQTGEGVFEDFVDVCNGDMPLEQFAPCPFCGERPRYDRETGMVECCDGLLVQGRFPTLHDAVCCWNHRGDLVLENAA